MLTPWTCRLCPFHIGQPRTTFGCHINVQDLFSIWTCTNLWIINELRQNLLNYLYLLLYWTSMNVLDRHVQLSRCPAKTTSDQLWKSEQSKFKHLFKITSEHQWTIRCPPKTTSIDVRNGVKLLKDHSWVSLNVHDVLMTGLIKVISKCQQTLRISKFFFKSSQFYLYSPVSQITICLKGLYNLYSICTAYDTLCPYT